MIIHYNHDQPTSVYVVNSRLPVYKAYYGDGLGNIIAGLFTRVAPKVAQLVKYLSMKAIDVIRDRGIEAVGNLTEKAFSTAKDKIISLKRNSKNFRRGKIQLPSTTVMPADISKIINNMSEEKLASLVEVPLDTQSGNIANIIAGRGLNRASKIFSRRE